MLAVLTCQVTCEKSGKSYWPYLPNPSTFQWENEDIPVCTNLTQLLGGTQSFTQLNQAIINSSFSSSGVSSSPPICFTTSNTSTIPERLPISLKGLLTDSPTFNNPDRLSHMEKMYVFLSN